MIDKEEYEYVANVEDFEDDSRVLIDIKGREIGLFQTEDGYFAVGNYCVHQGGPMCEGKVSGAVTASEDFELKYTKKGEVVSCPWHGWEFDVRTGEALADRNYRQPTYEVVVEDGTVYVEA